MFVNHYPAYGGPHNRVLRLRRPLAEAGWRLRVVLPEEPGNAASWLERWGVEVRQVPLSRIRRSKNPWPTLRCGMRAPSEIASLRREIREWDPDVVVVSNLLMPHGAIAGVAEGRPVLWQIVDTAVPPFLQRVLMPIVGALADCIIYSSPTLRRQHRGAEGLSPPFSIIPPPVDTARFAPNAAMRRSTRTELGLAEETPVIGQVVAINPKKGLEQFLEAAATLKESIPEARFWIIGSAHQAHADYLASLKALQRRLGLAEETVAWLGDTSEPERYYAAMDVFVISSVPGSEGTTTTAMEALSCEVPVVATEVGAVADVVVDGQNGYIIRPGSASDLARAVETLMSNKDVRSTFGAAGRRRTRRLFDVLACADRYQEAFAKGIGHRKGASLLRRWLGGRCRA